MWFCSGDLGVISTFCIKLTNSSNKLAKNLRRRYWNLRTHVKRPIWWWAFVGLNSHHVRASPVFAGIAVFGRNVRDADIFNIRVYVAFTVFLCLHKLSALA